MAKKTKWHKISNAYDAYWFLKEHPKLQRMLRSEISAEDADKLERKHFLVSRDTGGKCYRYFRHGTVAAIEENLDIFYTKTNKPGGHGRVDDDKRKNKYVECWLEFGPVKYGYAYSGGEKPQGDYDNVTIEHHYHDWKCDTGGSTFDQGLVNLARKVRKEYGDYAPRDGRDGKCGRPCGDCIDMRKHRGKLRGKRRTIKTAQSKKD